MTDWPCCFRLVVRQHTWQGSMAEQTLHLMARTQDRRDQGPTVPLKGTPLMTKNLPLGTPNGLYHLLIEPQAGDQTSNTGLWRTFQIQSTATPNSKPFTLSM